MVNQEEVKVRGEGEREGVVEVAVDGEGEEVDAEDVLVQRKKVQRKKV